MELNRRQRRSGSQLEHWLDSEAGTADNIVHGVCQEVNS